MAEPDDDIERLFDAARRRGLEPSAAFLELLDADAARIMDRNLRPAPVQAKPVAAFARLGKRLLWPAALTAATVGGLWIGSSPVVMSNLRQAYLQSDISYEFAYWFPQIAGMSGGY